MARPELAARLQPNQARGPRTKGGGDPYAAPARQTFGRVAPASTHRSKIRAVGLRAAAARAAGRSTPSPSAPGSACEPPAPQGPRPAFAAPARTGPFPRPRQAATPAARGSGRPPSRARSWLGAPGPTNPGARGLAPPGRAHRGLKIAQRSSWGTLPWRLGRSRPARVAPRGAGARGSETGRSQGHQAVGPRPIVSSSRRRSAAASCRNSAVDRSSRGGLPA